MGVSCLAHACIAAKKGPLSASQRARVLEIALAHGVVGATASAFEVESCSPAKLAQIGLMGLIVAGRSTPGLRHIGKAACGPWLVQEIGARADADILVCSEGAVTWNGTAIGEGGFSLLGVRSAIDVEATDPDTGATHTSGAFFDVLTLAGRDGPTAAELARSAFVNDVQKALGRKLVCSEAMF
jgi:xanthosine utilization system XapX-like protein